MKKLLSLLTLATLVLPLSLNAATFEAGDTYTLAPSVTVRDNLYTAGKTVLINGAVSGDVVSAGSNVTITGQSFSDALVAGETVNLNGVVVGDARVFGAHVNATGAVGGDFVAAGGNVFVSSSADIKGDALIAGGDVVFNGSVSKNLRIAAGTATLNGTVLGSVNFKGGKLIIGPNAVIKGALKVESNDPASISESATIVGARDFEKASYNVSWGKDLSRKVSALAFLMHFLLAFTALFILNYFVPKKTVKIVRTGLTSFGKSFLTGLIVFFAVPLSIIILMFTIIGILPAILLFLVYVLSLVASGIYTAAVFGTCLHHLYLKRKDVPDGSISWKVLALGVFALLIVKMIPIIGILVASIFFFTTFGAFSIVTYARLKKEK